MEGRRSQLNADSEPGGVFEDEIDVEGERPSGIFGKLLNREGTAPIEVLPLLVEILQAFPQPTAFRVLTHLEDRPEFDEAVDALHAHVWDNAGLDDGCRAVWAVFDGYYQQQMRYTIDAWERTGSKRANKPPPNKWRASRGNPNMYRSTT